MRPDEGRGARDACREQQAGGSDTAPVPAAHHGTTAPVLGSGSGAGGGHRCRGASGAGAPVPYSDTAPHAPLKPSKRPARPRTPTLHTIDAPETLPSLYRGASAGWGTCVHTTQLCCQAPAPTPPRSTKGHVRLCAMGEEMARLSVTVVTAPSRLGGGLWAQRVACGKRLVS